MSAYIITSRLTNLALDIEGSSSNAGAKVIPWDKHGRDNQLWYDDPSTGTIRSKLNNFVLDVEGDQLRVMPYQAGDVNQLWHRDSQGYIRNSRTNKVLDIFGGVKDKGAKIGQYDANGGPNQLWNFEFVGGSVAPVFEKREFHLYSDFAEKVLDIKGGKKDAGGEILIWSKNSPPSKNQLWYQDYQGNIRSALNDFGLVAESGHQVKTAPFTGDPRQQWFLQGNLIVNRASGECFDIKGGHKDNGTEVLSYKVQNSPNQQWKIQYI